MFLLQISFLFMMIINESPIIIQDPETVARFIKGNTKKTVKRHHEHHYQLHHHHRHRLHKRRRSYAGKSTISVSIVTSVNKSIATSINKSIISYRGRVLKFLSKVACCFVTKCGLLGYTILRQRKENEYDFGPRRDRELEFDLTTFFSPSPPAFTQYKLLPPLVLGKERTVILDLDETLVHTKPEPAPEVYDFVVRPNIDEKIVNLYVLKRPWLDEFLEEIGNKFEVVVFTAGLKEYASLVLDELDPKGLISYRLYRDECQMLGGRFLKDLSQLGRDLGKVLIVDDNPCSYALQPENAIPIKPFTGDDKGDRELEKLGRFLEWTGRFEDVRDAVKHARENL